MATSTGISSTGLLNLERELVCFICTEILYQPLTLIDCLHTFCGSCLKEWFSHQHRKATSSHSSSSSSSSNPYTCPTCRGKVKDAQHNAMVNTLLDMFLTANPSRDRLEEEKQEMSLIYKPGDNILPRVEGRRRERRGRREENPIDTRERRMIQEAQERSLRDLRDAPSINQDNLHVPSIPQQPESSRSRDREARRERRREQERQERRQQAEVTQVENVPGEAIDSDQHRRESTSPSVPATSPRNPEAVEARQRQQTVVHQASLASLISSSESATGSSSTDSDTNRIMQEILAEGLGILDGIDVDALTETEQDVLAERIAEAYRQRRRERNHRNSPSLENGPGVVSTVHDQSSNTLQIDDRRRHQRSESGSRQRRADTMPATSRDNVVGERPRSARTHPMDSSTTLPPQSSVIFTHRRRASSQGQHGDDFRNRSRHSSPGATSSQSQTQLIAEIAADRSHPQEQVSKSRQVGFVGSQRPGLELREPSRSSEAQIANPSDAIHPNDSSGSTRGNNDTVIPQSDTLPTQRSTQPTSIQGRPSGTSLQPEPNVVANVGRRFSGIYDEPSVSCFRCHRADIQYDVYKHCEACDLDLCFRCYRSGRGCRHWYGFGHAAMARFETLQPASYEQMELPHLLQLGRQYKRPEQLCIIRSKLAKDGVTIIPLQTTSNPVIRFQEGRFCDRCHNFANSCFWSCDYCNYGEWGFCRDCVNTNHCCTHPLLPSAHKSFASASLASRSVTEHVSPHSNEFLSANLRPSPSPSQPSSATSATSIGTGPLPDFVNLAITTHCDICAQAIPPSSYRFHCPFHPSPTSANAEAHGDYDICTPCYQNLVKTNRIKRDDGSAGWRKCPSGHRMIITTFIADNDGGQRRAVINDLVGGWKSPEEAMVVWNTELALRREQGGESPSSPFTGPTETSGTRRFVRARTGSFPADASSPAGISPFSSSSRFPPDGGTGLRGVALWSYFPDDVNQDPKDLTFPVGAEIREIKIHDESPDWCGGVYAGDRGLLPTNYVKI